MYAKIVISCLVIGIVCLQSQVMGAPRTVNGFKIQSDNTTDDIKFFLYTKSFRTTFLRIYKNSTNLQYMNFENPVIMLIHGFGGDITIDMIQGIKDQILNYYDANVIGVDWSVLADTIFYDKAANSTEYVGQVAADLLEFLVNQGAKLELLHVIGHSLGAQAAGFTGAYFKAGKLPRVTGLDPARPSFINTTHRINVNDAEFVDCVHTCAGILGMKAPVCHADFYVNGGTDPQPGCEDQIDFGDCSHERAYQIYTESIIPDHIFNARSCNGNPMNQNVTCYKSDAVMGYPASSKFQGIFHIRTNSKSPFSQNVTSTELLI